MLVKRRTRIAICAASMLGAAGSPMAQEQPSAPAVKAATEAFYSALSRRDIAAMEAVWATDRSTTLINPRDKSASIGWEAARANWNVAFSFWSDLKVTSRDMTVLVIGDTAAVSSTASVEGRTNDGKPAAFTALNTQVFEKRGGRWLLVSHHSSRSPE